MTRKQPRRSRQSHQMKRPDHDKFHPIPPAMSALGKPRAGDAGLLPIRRPEHAPAWRGGVGTVPSAPRAPGMRHPVVGGVAHTVLANAGGRSNAGGPTTMFLDPLGLPSLPRLRQAPMPYGRRRQPAALPRPCASIAPSLARAWWQCRGRRANRHGHGCTPP
jgi:hypothetical protein